MALTKEQKQAVSAKVDAALSEAGSVVFVHSKGLSVEENQEMRNTLREEGVSLYVAKKTLIKRALGERTYEGELPTLDGELALAWGEDMVAPAREIQAFVKSAEDKVFIRGGIFEGRYMDAAEMTEIAAIPSQHTLYAQFVNIINSPIQGFASALHQIAEKKEAAA